jgi:hypothetical protein
MARETYVWREGLGVIPKSEAEPLPWVTGVRPDGMDAIECPADGRTYDSRSAYYGAVKRAGCEILGSTERPPVRRQESGPPVAKSMRDAWQQLQSRR